MGQDMKAAPEKDERARENIWVYWTFPRYIRIVQFHPRPVPDIKKKNYPKRQRSLLWTNVHP